MAVRLVHVARSLLRYLYLAEVIPAPLEWAVPAVAPVRRRALPRGLSGMRVSELLAGCDRGRLVGRRDYAVLLLLVRLGLRASEVATLELGDLGWRAEELLVRGKGGRRDVLPLPVDVGEALASYLRARPCDRQVIGPHRLDKLRLLQTLKTQVESGHGEAFHPQSSALTRDQLNCVPETPLAQAAQRGTAMSQ